MTKQELAQVLDAYAHGAAGQERMVSDPPAIMASGLMIAAAAQRIDPDDATMLLAGQLVWALRESIKRDECGPQAGERAMA